MAVIGRRAWIVLLCLLATLVPLRSLDASEAEPFTAVLFDDAGSYIADDEPVIFRAPDRIYPRDWGKTSTSLDFQIDAGEGPALPEWPLHTFNIRLEPPYGQRLVAGLYPGAQRFRDETHPALDVGGDGGGCNGTAGEFLVHEAEYDPQTDEVVRFSASLRQLCEGSEPPLFAEIRYNSTLPLRALEAPYRLHFAGDDVGTPEGPSRAARVTNIGNEPVIVGPAVLTGERSFAFRIEADGCASRTLAPGEACEVAIRFRPTALECSDAEPASQAQLRIPDSTWRGYREVHLCYESHGVNGDVIAGSAGDGPATEVGMVPGGLTLHGGTLFVSDIRNHVVRQVDLSSGHATVVTGTGRSGYWLDTYGGVGAVMGELSTPRGLTTTREGRVVVADSGNDRVRIVRRDRLDVIAGDGEADPGDGDHANEVHLRHPWGVVANDNWDVYVVETDGHRVRKLRGGHIISTIAGDGTSGSAGDGGPATAARLNAPRGIALEPAGGIVISDAGNHRIRRIAPDGTITTIAGTGVAGASGDGGPATTAKLNGPSGLSFGPDGALFVADAGNGRVRRVAPDGTITTIAGGGVLAAADGVGATAARLPEPQDVAVADDGSIFVADVGTNRVWVVSGGVITAVAGNGACCVGGLETHALSRQLAGPSGVAAGDVGDVFFSEQFSHRLWRVAPDGALSVVAGTGAAGFSGDGGPASQARLSFPRAIARDRVGSLFVADTGNGRIRKIDALGRISTVAGGGAGGPGSRATSAKLVRPIGVAVEDDGDLYVADAGTSLVYKVDRDGILRIHAGRDDRAPGYSGDGGPATAARLNAPFGVSVDRVGNVYIADTSNDRVRFVDTCGTITTIAGGGSDDNFGRATEAYLRRPEAVAVAPDGGFYIADTGRQVIRDVTSSGSIDTDGYFAGGFFAGVPYDDQYIEFSSTLMRLLKEPRQVAIDASGDVLVADAGHGRIRRYEAESNPVDPAVCTRGELHPVGPSRIVDERRGAGAFDVQVGGRGGVPSSGAGAVLANVTASNGETGGYVQAYETGTPRPAAKVVHHGADENVAGTTIVPLDAAGRMTVYSSGSETRVVLDVLGWYSDGTTDVRGSRIVPIAPGRVLDTQTGTGVAAGPRPAGNTSFRATGRAGVPATGVAAVAVRFTATKAETTGSLIAYRCDRTRPDAKTLHYVPGRSAVNETVIPVGEDGRVCLTTSGRSTHLYADIVGWFRRPSAESAPPGRLMTVAPTRVVDTSSGTGVARGARGPGAFAVRIGGRAGVPDRGLSAVMVSITASDARSSGHLQAYSGARPAMKTLPYATGKMTATLALVPVSSDGTLTMYNSGASTHIAIDVLGFVT